MNILVTGSNGFIGKNLIWNLKNTNNCIIEYDSHDTFEKIEKNIDNIDCIIHLAGVCRTDRQEDFQKVNVDLTSTIVELLLSKNKKIPMIFTSSIQAELDNEYGRTKKLAEDSVHKLGKYGYVLRLHNAFGKWAKPNHHSVVATFCHNIANQLPIEIHNADSSIEFIYIDDIINYIVSIIHGNIENKPYHFIEPRYPITIGDLAKTIQHFYNCEKDLILPNFDDTFVKRLYATYLSYVPTNQLLSSLIKHTDQRGDFTELFKLSSTGQISFSTTKPGYTRAMHYHHSKVEKIVVTNGKAKIKLQSLFNNVEEEFILTSESLQIFTLAPGVYHEITNVGNEDLHLIIWSNQHFDKNNLDTYSLKKEGKLNEK